MVNQLMKMCSKKNIIINSMKLLENLTIANIYKDNEKINCLKYYDKKSYDHYDSNGKYYVTKATTQKPFNSKDNNYSRNYRNYNKTRYDHKNCTKEY